MANVATAHSEDGKKNFVQKPEKPDQALFDKNLKIAQDEHAAVREKLNAVKGRLDFVKAPGKSPRQQELREQLNALQAAQQAKKGGRAQIEEQMKLLDASIKAKIKELNAARGKLPYKTIEELDAAVRRLEANVEGGNMKLVDERKAVAEISSLNRVRKNFAAVDETQKIIDADRAKFDELRQQKKDPEVQELSDKFEAVKKELDEIKAEQDSAFKNLNSLRDERTKLQEEQQVKWQAIQTLKDEYFGAKNAFRAYEQEAWRIKREKWAKQEKEERVARRLEVAQRKMEEASEKAYASEIITCEGLIGFFDPSSTDAARKAKLAVEPRALAAQPTRAVDDSKLSGRKLSSKDEREDDYFVGSGGKKKGKRGRKEATSPAPGSGASTPAEPASTSGKFNLSFGILEELAKIDVEVPMGKDDFPKTLEKLREKLAWYKENQDIKTAENIAKAQKEIDRLAAETAKEDGEELSGTNTPKKQVEPKAKPQEEEKPAGENGASLEESEEAEKAE